MSYVGVSAPPRTESLTTNHRFMAHRATATGTQAIGSGTAAVVGYDTKDFDPGAAYDNVTNFTYTVPVTGYYLVEAHGAMASATDAVGTAYYMSIYDNGAEVAIGDRMDIEAVAISPVISIGVVAILLLTAGHTIDIRIFQNAGGNRNLGASTAANYFAAHLLSV